MVKSRAPSSILTTRPKNRLLAALPLEVFSRIAPHLHTVPTHIRQVFQKQGAPIEFVYFLNGGVGSMTTVLQGGTMVPLTQRGRPISPMQGGAPSTPPPALSDSAQ